MVIKHACRNGFEYFDFGRSGVRFPIILKELIMQNKSKRLSTIDNWRYTFGFLGSAINFGFWKPQLGDIFITDRCPVQCRFCIYSCNMKGSDMDKEDIKALVKMYAKYKTPFVRILGGEPFLVYDSLIYCLKEMKRYYKSEQITVVTSGYFSKSLKAATDKLRPLRELGLKNLTLSYDAMHLESLKEEWYDNTLQAATELGMNVELNITSSSKSYQLLPRIKYYMKKYNLTICLLKLYPFGSGAKLPKDELFSDKQHKIFSRELSYHRKKKGELNFSKIINFLYGTIFKNIMFCSHYTAFPNGDLHFCCVKNNNTLIGNFHKEDLSTLFKRVQRSWFSNLKKIIYFFFKKKNNVSLQCEVCVLYINKE